MRGAFEIDARSLVAFRAGLGFAVLLELIDRWSVLPVFYADVGVAPVADLAPAHRLACIHAWSGSLLAVQLLVLAHAALALAMIGGYRTRIVAPLCWYLYFSLTLRNCSIAYICDRMLHVLLLLAALLPHDTTAAAGASKQPARAVSVCTAATAAARLQLVWIYFDAGYAKWSDPDGAWLPHGQACALDTMMRHTPFAKAVRSVLLDLGGIGALKILSASVVIIEMAAPAAALAAAAMRAPRVQLACALTMCGLHFGIGSCMNNARILSFVGCVGWALYCPPLVWDAFGWRVAEMNRRGPKTSSEVRGGGLARPAALVVVVAAMVAHNLDLSPSTCTADVGPSYLVSAMLNNRWNVFTTAEDRVTWYVAPARLVDGSVVDLWTRGGQLSWEVPSTAPRAGRWKSFPALADEARSAPPSKFGKPVERFLIRQAGEAAAERRWTYLCDEWNSRHVEGDAVVVMATARGGTAAAAVIMTGYSFVTGSGRRVRHFKFYLLSAAVVPRGDEATLEATDGAWYLGEGAGGDGGGGAVAGSGAALSKRLLGERVCDDAPPP